MLQSEAKHVGWRVANTGTAIIRVVCSQRTDGAVSSVCAGVRQWSERTAVQSTVFRQTVGEGTLTA
jgi:hypothetical protein